MAEETIGIEQPDGSVIEETLVFPDDATDEEINEIVNQSLSGTSPFTFRSEGRPGPPAPQPASGLTTGQDLTVKAVRFGPNIITAPAGLATSIPISIASEIAATRLEDFFKDPDSFDNMSHTINQAIGGGFAGAIDLITFGLVKGTGALVDKLFQKFAIGKQGIPVDAQTALDLLKKIRDEGGPNLSPTFAQMNPKAQKFINTMEAVARASFGGKGRFDIGDDAARDAIFNRFLRPYLLEEADQMTSKEYGDFMFDMIGSLAGRDKTKSDILGKAFNPLEAYRKHLYNISDANIASAPHIKTNANDFRELITGTGEGQIMEDVRALLKIAPGGDKFLPHLTSPKGIQKWRELDTKTADDLIKRINNRLGGSIDNNTARILNDLKNALSPSVQRAIRQISPEALSDWTRAKDFFHIARKSGLYGGIIKQIRETLTSRPAAVRDMLDVPGRGKDLFHRLMEFKDAMQFSDTVQKTAIYEGVNVASPFGEAGFEVWWHESVRKPLQHSFIVPGLDAEGNILIKPLDAHIKKMMAHGDNYAKEIFHNPNIAKDLQSFITGMKVVQRKPARETMFVNLMQGGKLVELGTKTSAVAAAGVGFGVPVAKEVLVGTALGTMIVFGTPRLFTEFLASSKLTRMIIEGITQGPRSQAGIQLVRKVISMRAAEEDVLLRLSSSAFDYFTSIQQEENPQSLTEQFEPDLIDPANPQNPLNPGALLR